MEKMAWFSDHKIYPGTKGSNSSRIVSHLLPFKEDRFRCLQFSMRLLDTALAECYACMNIKEPLELFSRVRGHPSFSTSFFCGVYFAECHPVALAPDVAEFQ